MAWLTLGKTVWQTFIGIFYEKGLVLGMVGYAEKTEFQS